MGIKDLYSVIKAECPKQLVTEKLSTFSGYRVSIDISVFLYKFIRSAGPDRWIDTFINLMCTLKRNSIRAICIFDGSNFPVEKKGEQDSRRSSTAKIREKIKELERLSEKLQLEYIPYDLSVTDLKDEIRTILRINPLEDTTNYKIPEEVNNLITKNIEKFVKQTIPITSAFAEKAMEVMDILGVSYIQADGEAETLCAYLAVNGKVDCVLTEDTDVLPYGTPIMLSKLDLTRQTVTVIQYKHLIKALGLTYDTFKDLCIILGCDYNERCKVLPKKKGGKPVGVGAKKSFDFITEYGRIENFEDQIVDNSVLKYKRCRELFSVNEQIKVDVKVTYPGKVDKEKLQEFLRENNCSIPYGFIVDLWERVDMVFE